VTGFREAVVDLGAITRNVRRIAELAGTRDLMAVVKASGYGHGALEVAQAALAGGATWLGVADIAEGLELRRAGLDAPILAWLYEPDADFTVALAADVTLGVSSVDQLERIAALAGSGPARLHLKLETGLSRNGVSRGDWDAVFSRSRELEGSGRIAVEGIFTHLSNTSDDHDRAAIARFEEGLRSAAAHGLTPTHVHAAATCAAIRVPESRYTMVRIGIGMYGLSPIEGTTSADLGLTPAMTLRARVAAVRRVPPGTSVSYGYTWQAPAETTLALVPVGYADGIPRQASNAGFVSIRGGRFPVAGRIAMDQFVVDVGDADVEVGDDVVVFGDPATGVPSADDWAEAAGTINYDIVTRIGPRVARRYVAG